MNGTVIGAAKLAPALELTKGDSWRVAFRITNARRDLLPLTGHDARGELWTRFSSGQPATLVLSRAGLLDAATGVVTLELSGAETLALLERRLLAVFVHLDALGRETTLLRADVDVRPRAWSGA